MAYENSGMLGLVSPGGRGYLAGEQQGLTPEQMAQNGAITFAEAIALKQKADRMRASMAPMQAQQQQTPKTVVDELNAQVMQGAGQVQPSPDMSAMIAGNAARYARGGGITTLPANVGNYSMASGGIVAFSKGDPVQGSTNFQNISKEELTQLSKSPDRATAQAATRELLNRSGYKPFEFPSSEVIAQRFQEALNTDKPTRIYYDSRPLPGFMRNEAGIPRVREDFPERFGLPPKDAETVPGSAAPTPATPPDTDPLRKLEYVGGAGTRNRATFDLEAPPTPIMSQAQIAEMFRTEPYVTGGGRSNSGLAGLASGTYKPSTDALDTQRKDIQGRKYDTAAEYEKLGIGAASKAQEAKINKQLDELPKDRRFAAMMALSEAGFRMAGTASKPGATFLGAAAEGGTEGLKSYTASRKDIRDREERLGDKQGALAQTREDLARLAADKDEALRRGDRDQLQQIALKEAELKSEESRLSLQLRDSAANRSAMLARDQDPDRKMTSLYYQLKLAGKDEEAERVINIIAERSGIDVRLLKAQLDNDTRIKQAEIRNQGSFGGLGGLGGGGFNQQSIAEELARRQGQ